MQKIVFWERAELKQGDGLGPVYEQGKAYWLPLDQADRWRTEGVAGDAPDDMPAENERGLPPLHPNDMRIVKVGKKSYDVVHRDGTKFNDEPLTAHEAEVLRRDLIANGRLAPVVDMAAAPVEIEAPAPAVDTMPRSLRAWRDDDGL